ncbi:MAG: hypothetical protein JWR05_189 [Mucilaginibacter sp.]|nr:hypothetical protein [Mucilaginibacter sp.]
MNRLDLINFLINQRNYKRYLEICAYAQHNNFNYIRCDYKVTTYPGSSDLYFYNNQQKFDIIFVDGVHTEYQSGKDIAESLRCLSPGGVIVIHDCMPPDRWHQRDPEEFKEGEIWNGTVWKAALRAFNKSTFKCTLVDTDWGCGIIDTSLKQDTLCKTLPEKLDYSLHYSWLLEYKTSVLAYLRDQVKVFYHLACMGNWQEVFKEQLLQLSANGFRDINMTILGSEDDLRVVNSIMKVLDVKNNIIFHAPELTYFEKPALLAIEKYALEHEGFVLYLHSKGVSNSYDHTKIKWRRLMMHELVENWKFCMQQLPHYDAIGVNWREMYPTSHFCGNFWYASTKYLRKLLDFSYYYDNPRYHIWDSVNSKRLGCEFWISSSQENPKVLSLFCKNVDFCNPRYWN